MGLFLFSRTLALFQFLLQIHILQPNKTLYPYPTHQQTNQPINLVPLPPKIDRSTVHRSPTKKPPRETNSLSGGVRRVVDVRPSLTDERFNRRRHIAFHRQHQRRVAFEDQNTREHDERAQENARGVHCKSNLEVRVFVRTGREGGREGGHLAATHSVLLGLYAPQKLQCVPKSMYAE